jgi:hypothetical protein
VEEGTDWWDLPVSDLQRGREGGNQRGWASLRAELLAVSRFHIVFPFSFHIKSVLYLFLSRKLCADPKIVKIFEYVLCSEWNIGKMLNSIF